MPDLVELLNEISVAFALSSNLRTLLPRLAPAMARHLPVVEVEALHLDREGQSVQIAAHAPESGRCWIGQRSARFLHRQAIRGAVWCDEVEPARVAMTPVAARLKIMVGHAGLLSIGFETDISVEGGATSNTEIWVSSLQGHCARLGQLDATARRCRHAHREVTQVTQDTEDTETSVKDRSEPGTDIPVRTLDAAIIDCISSALQATGGQIYGKAGAAKLLGLKPSTLQSKMRRLGIARSDFVSSS
ncbi:hypothetical protein ENSA5_04580 [Enhygromyxa salina]|uniref:Uncharacterized protein n=1 Tax=Enhygromyxa salina TaxID=215803 RepID=A0A2S9YJ05_9BACT|nr:hypothetical protein [Enhygromyxa salina]PRQ05032.1 hypothetical protein ENSA5_04580 [Enhygromyxa salina]